VLRPEQIEEYRRMTVRERLRLTLELTAFAEAALAALPPEERDRRLRILYEQKRASSDKIVRRLAST
jgi:DNA-binding IclR family transcriptional regulator